MMTSTHLLAILARLNQGLEYQAAYLRLQCTPVLNELLGQQNQQYPNILFFFFHF